MDVVIIFMLHVKSIIRWLLRNTSGRNAHKSHEHIVVHHAFRVFNFICKEKTYMFFIVCTDIRIRFVLYIYIYVHSCLVIFALLLLFLFGIYINFLFQMWHFHFLFQGSHVCIEIGKWEMKLIIILIKIWKHPDIILCKDACKAVIWSDKYPNLLWILDVTYIWSFLSPNQRYDKIIALSNCVFCFKLVSQVCDVAHGPLDYILHLFLK